MLKSCSPIPLLCSQISLFYLFQLVLFVPDEFLSTLHLTLSYKFCDCKLQHYVNLRFLESSVLVEEKKKVDNWWE